MVRSQLVLGGRFRVFEDGSVNSVFDGVESPANIVYTGTLGRRYKSVYYHDSRTGKQKKAYVHRLVAKAFVPNPNNFPQVNHIDGNRLNNNASNLEWCTQQRNVDHAAQTGLAFRSAGAQPCKLCGVPTLSDDGICKKCKDEIESESKKIRKRAQMAERYSSINLDVLTPTERSYVTHAAIGKTVSEIALEFGVTRQAVSSALISAEQKSATVPKMSSEQKNQLSQLLGASVKAAEKYRRAQAELAISYSELAEIESQLNSFISAIEFYYGYVVESEPLMEDATERERNDGACAETETING